MKFFIKTIPFFVISMMLFACQTAKVFTSDTFENQRFVKQNDTTPPEYGGAPFLDFQKDNIVHVLTGDMVELASYKIDGNQMTIKTQYGKPRVFKIVNAKTLKDQQGEWKVEK